MSDIHREYEITIGDDDWAVDVSISEDGDGLRFEIDSYVHTITISVEGQRLELPDPVRRRLEELIDYDAEAIRRHLDQLSYEAAIDAKISERKEGGR